MRLTYMQKLPLIVLTEEHLPGYAHVVSSEMYIYAAIPGHANGKPKQH